MPPIVSVVGKSNSGKTQLLEGLVGWLTGKGYRVAVIKHSKKFDVDPEGKDSSRLARAGSSTVVLDSPERVTINEQLAHDLSLEELLYRLVGQFDIIFTEGFKKSGAVKIEVHRRDQGGELINPPTELFAVVTDEPLKVSAPQYAPGDAARLAGVIEQTFLGASRSSQDVEIFVNGKAVPVGPFVKDIVDKVMVALLSTLKGVDVDQIKQADVRLRRGQQG